METKKFVALNAQELGEVNGGAAGRMSVALTATIGLKVLWAVLTDA